MQIYLLFTLRVLFIPLALTQIDLSQICHFSGQYFISESNFPGLNSTNDLPKGCNVFIYGVYMYDNPELSDIKIYPDDQASIQVLKQAQKSVFMYFSYYSKTNWNEWINSTDNKYLGDLTTAVNKFKIDGFVIFIKDYFDKSITEPDLCSFIGTLKKAMPNLIIGVTVFLDDEIDKYTDDSLFDFSSLNSVVDFYYILTDTRETFCSADVLKTGTLLNSTDPKAYTTQKICDTITKSTIDKQKAIAKVLIEVLIDDQGDPTTFSQFCDKANAAVVSKWCADNSQKFYDEVKLLKNTFHGVSVAWLDYDDFQGICNCQKYPVTNIILDAWSGAPLTACPGIDSLTYT